MVGAKTVVVVVVVTVELVPATGGDVVSVCSPVDLAQAAAKTRTKKATTRLIDQTIRSDII